jgi:hypothetical protein
MARRIKREQWTMDAFHRSAGVRINQAIERVERDAWLDLFRAAPEDYVRASGLVYATLSDAAALANSDVPIAEFNRVFGLDRPYTHDELDRAIGWLQSNAALGWAIQLSPATRPAEVMDWLNQRGLARAGTGWAKFYRSASAEPSQTATSSLDVRGVDAPFARDFGRVVQTGFGLPPSTAPWFAALPGRPGWNAYLAFDGERPVAAAAMFIDGDWAWLGIDATLADARARGA